MKVYLDNAATTMVCCEAAEASMKVMTESFGNPSSGHSLGREAAAILRDSREAVANALGAKSAEVFFTSGGTESDNLAIRSAAKYMRHRGRHIITSAVEHDAVRKTMDELSGSGWDVTVLSPDKNGRITVDSVKTALREDTVLVSLMIVNNETGAVTPVREIADMLKATGSNALLHTDAVQGFMKIPFAARNLGADLISISSHKIHGPKGVGALYVRQGLHLSGMVTGGSQENGFRPGTEPLPAIAGFGTAAVIAKSGFNSNAEHMASLRKYTVELLSDKLPNVVFVGQGDAPHILSISLPGYKSEVLMNYLDAAGICVSKSSACKKGARSHVLEAMGLGNDIIDGAIRVSFSRYNTREEIEYFADNLVDAVSKLKTAKR